MEWVETTGKTVEEAKDAALDELGVDEVDAEFEIIEEPRAGLFGRVRGEARVRARVAPRAPRPKADRRDRKRGRDQKKERPAKSGRDGAPAGRDGAGAGKTGSAPAATATDAAAPADDERPAPAGGEKAQTMDEPVTVQEQAEIMEGFLAGLLDAFGTPGSVTAAQVDDETIELAVDGEDLGLLIGPKGQTLQAVQDLARTVVQRRAAGPHEGRVRVDIGGYRQRRGEALARFTTQVAETVRESGSPKALEPMGAADRKIVHDTANGIEGVHTTSEGVEPRRWVVILPD